MHFLSLDFAIFLPLVFIFYWFIFNKNVKTQNSLIVIASYIFYGWWDWRFLLLIFVSTTVDYTVGIALSKQEVKLKRKALLWTSILVNLGLLGFFKYYNFLVENFVDAFSFFGQEIQQSSLQIILPIGISFYTFQTLSYTIDIYRRKLDPTTDFVAFSGFVCFFPQLVAGPIERAVNLLPQFLKERAFDYSKAVNGMKQILWGLFKKIVIADNCAEYVNLIFSSSSDYSGSTLVLGGILFTFQVYADFSAYSDIAIGTSRLFGFKLTRNFAFPLFSRNMIEFWRRWHITLMEWFKEYLYIPLGGSRIGIWVTARNVFIVFVISGLWHGATWTFVIWGVLNAVYILPLLFRTKKQENMDIIAKGKLFPSIKDVFSIVCTFGLTVLAMTVFRSENIYHAMSYISTVFSWSIISVPDMKIVNLSIQPITLIYLLGVFYFFEWAGREDQFAIEDFATNKPRVVRWCFYLGIVFHMIVFNNTSQDFIYFQF